MRAERQLSGSIEEEIETKRASLRRKLSSGKILGSLGRVPDVNDATIKCACILLTVCFVLPFLFPGEDDATSRAMHRARQKRKLPIQPVARHLERTRPLDQQDYNHQLAIKQVELGNQNAAVSNFQQAAFHFKKATELKPDYAKAFYRKGQVCVGLAKG